MNEVKRTDDLIEKAVLAQLSRVTVGENGESVVSEGHVYDVVSVDGVVRVLIDLDKAPLDDLEELAPLLGRLANEVDGVKRAVVKPRPVASKTRRPIPGVARIVLVHSGKGGVGKSTVTANLALALAAKGLRVGVLDADVYGPSQPVLFGLSGRAEMTAAGDKIAAMEASGVKVMSLGFLMANDQALVWRGSLVDEGIPQLFFDVDWGVLDLLLVDMPPGTSDVHLAIAHRVEVAGVVTVTAPGQTSVQDVMRGVEMFADLAVPCLGVIENMAQVVCPKCDGASHPFGAEGGRILAQSIGVPLLAVLPFETMLAKRADTGKLGANDDAMILGDAFADLAAQLMAKMGESKETN
jgi:ATP-binding protein involved in chromosome partitioning